MKRLRERCRWRGMRRARRGLLAHRHDRDAQSLATWGRRRAAGHDVEHKIGGSMGYSREKSRCTRRAGIGTPDQDADRWASAGRWRPTRTARGCVCTPALAEGRDAVRSIFWSRGDSCCRRRARPVQCSARAGRGTALARRREPAEGGDGGVCRDLAPGEEGRGVEAWCNPWPWLGVTRRRKWLGERERCRRPRAEVSVGGLWFRRRRSHSHWKEPDPARASICGKRCAKPRALRAEMQ